MVKKHHIAFVLVLLLVGLSSQAGSSLAQKTEAERLFGYNPHYSEIPQVDPAHKKVALLCLHGFGCPRGENYKEYFPGNERYFGVFFDFKDTLLLNKASTLRCILSPLQTIKGICSINVGQIPDAEVALYGLIQLWKAGHKTVIVGHSRGGAAAANMLAAMYFPEEHPETWKKLGFTKNVSDLGASADSQEVILDTEKIESLKKSVIKVYFEKPLLSIKRLIRDDLQGVMDKFTSFNKTAQQPIEILARLVDKKIPMQFTLVQVDGWGGDRCVYNWYDKQLAALAAQTDCWKITHVKEGHIDIQATKNILDEDLKAWLNPPAPVATAQLKKHSRCRCR